MDRYIDRFILYVMNRDYKATTMVELLIVMILTGIVTMVIYRSYDIMSLLAERIAAADAAVESVTDSLQLNYNYVQDSIYYAELDSLKMNDKINEMQYDK